MDLNRHTGRSLGVKALLLVLCLAAIAVPAASAKGQLTITIPDRTPVARQAFDVYVHTGWTVPKNDWLRLIAVAPGKGWFNVVGRVTGDSSRARANLPHDGFEMKLARTGSRSWRAVVRLPRAGRWRLVVPNGTHLGFMVPPPAAWMPWVDVIG
jgi:hypothetical protein